MDFNEVLNLDSVVFYDGNCGFCNAAVQLILKWQKKPFYFIALQTNLAQKILEKYSLEVKMDTIYLLEKKQLFSKAKAIYRIARNLKGGYFILYYLGFIVPPVIGDGVYSIISKYRHRITTHFCVLPSPQEKIYFLTD